MYIHRALPSKSSVQDIPPPLLSVFENYLKPIYELENQNSFKLFEICGSRASAQ